MPLSNRAPVNAAGQIMVTGTTPTPAWPVLGGMTYDPVTGELAVTSAVPNTTDPWVGGLRFTNLGALYIVTTIPSPVFYVGGLPVSTLGQLFMSANPPVGSVGGWPIAGDGGVAGIGSGIGPVPIFWAPLITTLVPTLAGNPTFTFTRATTAYVADNEGILRNAIANEARFAGARRVRNWLLKTDFSASWNFVTATSTPGVADPVGGTAAITLTANAANSLIYQQPVMPIGSAVNSIWIRRRTGSGTILLSTPGNVPTDITGIVTSAWRRISMPGTLSSTLGTLAITLAVSGDAVDLYGPQIEIVDGQSNQAPGDYVSVGVLSAPYHGAGTDSVKYFATTNGNSVAGNVVTEATGTLIPTATLLGVVCENAATNICIQSQTFDVAGWVKDNCVVPPVATFAAAAPDGTLTAERFTDDATSAFHRVNSPVFLTAVQPYAASVYLKAGTLTWAQVLLYDSTTTKWANFNLQTGVVGNKGAGATATITALPNGWYRCTVLSTSVGFAGSQLIIYSINADSATVSPVYVGTGQTMYLWGAQVEQSSDPTSYIPTVAVSVTRNDDNLTYPVVSNIDGTVGSLYDECYLPIAMSGIWQTVEFWVGSGNALSNFHVSSKGRTISSGAALTANARIIGSVNKSAGAWSAATASVSLNGAAVATGTHSAASYPNSGNVRIGFGLGGSIRNVKFYATRLTDADLITMTA